MALLKVAKLGNPILRRIAEPIAASECETAQFQRFLDDMIETMRALDGVGLAAPQVLCSKQVIVIESEANSRYPQAPDLSLLVLLNPAFTYLSEEKQEGWEGCLSLENLRGKVVRSLRVSVKGVDRQMRPLEFDAEGFLAVVLQHEIDHLNGTVFIDRMTDFTTLTHLPEFEQYWSTKPAAVG